MADLPTGTRRRSAPERIQLSRAKGWRLPLNAVSVARPTIYGNPFRFHTTSALARVPAALGDAPWEYEGRISADGARHDYHHPDGRVTACHVRYMTLAEIVETYRRALTGDLTPAMRSASPSGRFLRVTVADVRRDLAGKDLACWCPAGQPCHVDVLLEVANTDALCTLQFSWGGLFDGQPAEDYAVHLIRRTSWGTPGPALCGIDRFAAASPGWSAGGGITGPGIIHKPCPGCAAAARARFPGLPVAGSIGASEMAKELGVEVARG